MSHMPRRTSLSLSDETKTRLSKFGYAGESLETALLRVLEMAEELKRLREEQDKRN